MSTVDQEVNPGDSVAEAKITSASSSSSSGEGLSNPAYENDESIEEEDPAIAIINEAAINYELGLFKQMKTFNIHDVGGGGDCGPAVASYYIQWLLDQGAASELFDPSLFAKERMVSKLSVRKAVAKVNTEQPKPKPGQYWDDTDWMALAELVPFNCGVLKVVSSTATFQYSVIPCTRGAVLESADDLFGDNAEARKLLGQRSHDIRYMGLSTPPLCLLNVCPSDKDSVADHFMLLHPEPALPRLKNYQSSSLNSPSTVEAFLNSLASTKKEESKASKEAHGSSRKTANENGPSPTSASEGEPSTSYLVGSWMRVSTHPLYRLHSSMSALRDEEERKSGNLSNGARLIHFCDLTTLCFDVLKEESKDEGKHSDEWLKQIPCILMVGDQSSGKTSMLGAVTGQLSFTIDKDTGTVVRTLISSYYRKSASSATGMLRYKGTVKSDLSMEELTSEYEKRFAGPNKDLSLAPGPICQVDITSPVPFLGMTTMDHPGFVLKDLAGYTTKASVDSIRRFAIEGKSILCLTQSIEVEPDRGGFLTLSNLGQIPDGRLVFAVTKMDLLSPNKWGSYMYDDRDERGYREDSNGDIHVTPLEILLYIKSRFLKAKAKQSTGGPTNQLPPHTEFFFTATCSIAVRDLVQKKGARNLQELYSAFIKSQNDNMEAGINILTNAREWKKYRVVLEDMNEKDEKKFRSMLGVPKLFSSLIKKQTLARSMAIRTAFNDLKTREGVIEDKLRASLRELDSGDTVAGILPQFIEAFPQVYNSLTAQQPYSGIREERVAYQNNNGASPSKFSNLDIRNSFDFLSTDPEFGFTGEQMEKILEENFSKEYPPFPPREFCPSDFDEILTEHLPSMVRNYFRSENSLSPLLMREQAIFAFRCAFAMIHKVDFDTIFKARKLQGGVDANNVTSAVAHYIASIHQQLMGRHGDLHVAFRVALSFLLHAQVTLDVLQRIPFFQSLFCGEQAAKLATLQAKMAGDEASSEEKEKFQEEIDEIMRDISESKSQLTEDLAQWSCQPRGVKMIPVQTADQRQQDAIYGKLYDVEAFLKSTIIQHLKHMASGTTTSPRQHIYRALISQYFDMPFESVYQQQSSGTTSLELCQPSFLPLLVSCSSLLIEANPEIFREYASQYQRQTFSVEILSTLFDETVKLADKTSPGKLDKLKNSELKHLGRDAIKQALKPLGGGLTGDAVNMIARQAENLIRVQQGPRITTYSFQPLHYKDPEARPLSQLNPSQKDVIRTLVARQRDGLLDRAQLISDLIRLDNVPDVFVLLDAKDYLNETEKHLMEFAVKRFVSTGVFLKLLAVLMNISSVQYPYMQDATRDSFTNELYERILSLLAGYPYPYSAKQRPEALSYLEPEKVVRFLHLSMPKLKKGIEVLRKNSWTCTQDPTEGSSGSKKSSSSSSEEEAPASGEKLSSEFIWYSASPIAHYVIHDLLYEDEKKRRETESEVESWYRSLLAVQTAVNWRQFAIAIVTFLASRVYDQSTHRKVNEANVKILSEELRGILEMKQQLLNILSLMEASPNPIITAMLEVVEAGGDVDAVECDIPPFFVPTSVGEAIRRDVEKIQFLETKSGSSKVPSSINVKDANVNELMKDMGFSFDS